MGLIRDTLRGTAEREQADAMHRRLGWLLTWAECREIVALPSEPHNPRHRSR